MSIVDRLTPKYYRLLRVILEQRGTDVAAIAKLHILNAEGEVIAPYNPAVTLLPQEKQAVVTFVLRELGMFEANTGLTRWQEEE